MPATERAVQKIISDLEQDGYLTHIRQGRSNVYHIEPGTILRHPAEAGLSVEGLLTLLDQHEARRDGRPEREQHSLAFDHSARPATD